MRLIFLLLAVLALLKNWPILLGQVPLPSDMHRLSPPWGGVPGEPAALGHAEQGDLLYMFYPWRAFAAQAVKQGEWPLWNPHIFLGDPFLGNPLSALFYPLNIPYYLLPTPLAWSLGFVLRPLLAAFLTACLLLALGATRTGAIVGGITFASSGFMQVWQGWPQVDAGLWLPLIGLGLLRLRRAPGWSSILLTAAAFAMIALSGHPEVAAHMTLFGVGMALWQFATPATGAGGSSRARYAMGLGAAALLAAGFSAIQCLPSFEWLGQTARSLADPMGANHLERSQAFAFFSRDTMSSPNSAGILIPEGATYVGMLALVAAPLSILHPRRSPVIFFVLALLCALQVMYGWGPAFFFTRHAPVLSGMPNWRLALLAGFALAVLAGLGITAVMRRAESGVRPGALHTLLWALAVAASGIGIAKVHALEAARGALPAWHLGAGSSLACLAAAALLLSPLGLRFLPGRVFALLAVLLTATDAGSYGYLHVPWVSLESLYPRTAALDFIGRLDRTQYRAISEVSHPNLAMIYGTFSPVGYDFATRRTLSVLAPVTAGDLTLHVHPLRGADPQSHLLDLMSVRYILAYTPHGNTSPYAEHPDRFQPVFREGSMTVFENERALPRARLLPAEGVRVVPDSAELLRRLTASDFDPARTVLVDAPVTWPPDGGATAAPAARSQVRMVHDGTATVEMDADTDHPAVLILGDAYYPGWNVQVDGTRQRLLNVNHNFRGVALPAGHHRVCFTYRPASLLVGASVTFLTCLCAVGITLTRR